MTRLADLGGARNVEEAIRAFEPHILHALGQTK
jgi:hypothetical protein